MSTEKVKLVFSIIGSVWDELPKELKVFVYIVGAAMLDQLAVDLKPELLTAIPVVYRVSVFNLIEIFLVETAKRLKEQRSK